MAKIICPPELVIESHSTGRSTSEVIRYVFYYIGYILVMMVSFPIGFVNIVLRLSFMRIFRELKTRLFKYLPRSREILDKIKMKLPIFKMLKAGKKECQRFKISRDCRVCLNERKQCPSCGHLLCNHYEKIGKHRETFASSSSLASLNVEFMCQFCYNTLLLIQDASEEEIDSCFFSLNRLDDDLDAVKSLLKKGFLNKEKIRQVIENLYHVKNASTKPILDEKLDEHETFKLPKRMIFYHDHARLEIDVGKLKNEAMIKMGSATIFLEREDRNLRVYLSRQIDISTCFDGDYKAVYEHLDSNNLLIRGVFDENLHQIRKSGESWSREYHLKVTSRLIPMFEAVL